MKSLTLVFYGRDGDAAKAVAASIRLAGGGAQLRHAYAFDDSTETCDRVVLTECVSDAETARLVAAYGDKVAAPGAALLPPPPPPPFDPLDNLAPDWRNRQDVRQLAAAVAGGRSVENKAQAVAVIEAALRARTAK